MDLAQEPASDGVVGFDLDREPEVLVAEDRKAPRLAPEGQADEGVGVASGRRLDRFILGEVGRRPVGAGHHQDTSEEEALEHRPIPLQAWKSRSARSS